MIIEDITLRQLLDIAHNEGEEQSIQKRLRDSQVELEEAVGTMRAIWSDSNSKVQTFPTAIIIDSSRRRNLLAWVITYLPQLRPFTAFCRILAPLEYDECLKRESYRKQPDLGLFEEACLGLLLGEIGTLTSGSIDLRSISLIGCEATLSYSVMRALALGVPRIDVREMRLGWTSARTLMKSGSSPIETEQFELPWRILIGLATEQGSQRHDMSPECQDIFIACSEIFQFGRVLPKQWAKLTKGWNSEEIEEVVDRPREERVIRVRRLLESLAIQTKGDRGAFLAGYLVNQIGPGSFEHFAMLLPILEKLPGVLMWYGLCAGLRRKAFLRNFSGSLGRKILRDAVRRESIVDQPSCDISLTELEILNVRGEYKGDLRFGSHGHVSVEIAPCINTFVKAPQQLQPNDRRSSTNQPPQGTLFEDHSNATIDTQQALSELLSVFAEIDRIKARVGKIINTPESKKSKRKGQNR